MPEAILPIVTIISLIILKVKFNEYQYARSARIAMAVMLVITGIAHFVFVKGMAMMIPGMIPYKKEIIYGTGILEIVTAAGILIPRYQRITGWLLIVFFIIILPANIYAAMKGVDMENAVYHGRNTEYLWYRIPLQVLFIIWIYFSCVFYSADNIRKV